MAILSEKNVYRISTVAVREHHPCLCKTLECFDRRGMLFRYTMGIETTLGAYLDPQVELLTQPIKQAGSNRSKGEAAGVYCPPWTFRPLYGGRGLAHNGVTFTRRYLKRRERERERSEDNDTITVFVG